MKYKLWLIILSILVVFSLALNAGLLFALFQARDAARDVVVSARNTIAVMSAEPLETTVTVDQHIPLNTVVPFSKTVTIPLDIVYPLTTVVNTYVDLPVIGRQDIALPIDTVIPIQYNLSVPINEDIPISLTYHLNVDVPIAFEVPAEIRAPLDQWLEKAESVLK